MNISLPSPFRPFKNLIRYSTSRLRLPSTSNEWSYALLINDFFKPIQSGIANFFVESRNPPSSVLPDFSKVVLCDIYWCSIGPFVPQQRYNFGWSGSHMTNDEDKASEIITQLFETRQYFQHGVSRK